VPDFEPYRFHLVTELVIPEAQHLDSLGFKILVSFFVVLLSGGETVSSAIQLDGELGLGAVEIEDVLADGMLAAKFKILEAPVPEEFPQLSFGGGGLFAEALGLALVFGVVVRRPLTCVLSPGGGEDRFSAWLIFGF